MLIKENNLRKNLTYLGSPNQQVLSSNFTLICKHSSVVTSPLARSKTFKNVFYLCSSKHPLNPKNNKKEARKWVKNEI